MTYVATILYCPMAFFTKVAILVLLVRIFAPYRGAVRSIYGILGCLSVYYIVALILKIRMCDPIPLFWLGGLLRQDGTCFNLTSVIIADSTFSMVSDLIILLLPIPLTWTLQMSWVLRLRVIGLLSAGGVAVAFSICRLAFVLQEGPSDDMSIFITRIILTGYGFSQFH